MKILQRSEVCITTARLENIVSRLAPWWARHVNERILESEGEVVIHPPTFAIGVVTRCLLKKYGYRVTVRGASLHVSWKP